MTHEVPGLPEKVSPGPAGPDLSSVPRPLPGDLQEGADGGPASGCHRGPEGKSFRSITRFSEAASIRTDNFRSAPSRHPSALKDRVCGTIDIEKGPASGGPQLSAIWPRCWSPRARLEVTFNKTSDASPGQAFFLRRSYALVPADKRLSAKCKPLALRSSEAESYPTPLPVLRHLGLLNVFSSGGVSAWVDTGVARTTRRRRQGDTAAFVFVLWGGAASSHEAGAALGWTPHSGQNTTHQKSLKSEVPLENTTVNPLENATGNPQ